MRIMGTPVMGTPPEQRGIDELLRRVSWLGSRHAEQVAARHGLGRRDLHALTMLVEARFDGARLSAGELSEQLGLSPSAVTALLDRLERIGHVRREHSVDDRRRVEVQMTDSALTEAAGMFVPLGRAMAGVRSRYTDDELRLVARFLADVADTVETLTDP